MAILIYFHIYFSIFYIVPSAPPSHSLLLLTRSRLRGLDLVTSSQKRESIGGGANEYPDPRLR